MLRQSLRLSPRSSSLVRSQTAQQTTSSDALTGHDPEQIRLMRERLILVDTDDNPIGNISKKDAHLVQNDLPLHRAFSLFLFDTHGRMLLQKRAACKITFPSYWTNTVCSHPLDTPTETGESDHGDVVMGTKRAVVRKLGHELGVQIGALELDELTFLTRVQYRANNDCGLWGEHEMDYVFIAQKDVEVCPQQNEVSEVRFVDKNELQELFQQAETEQVRLTPWFRHIMKGFGWKWWEVLMKDGLQGVEKLQDNTIHRMGV